jgi:hypothetical protein
VTDAQAEAQLTSTGLDTGPRRAVYADWLLERDDPRGAVLLAADALARASGTTAKARADARLDLVAALKRLAVRLDERVPEGRPWRSADIRGVTSDALGFLTHEQGVFRQFRVAPGRQVPLPRSLFDAVSTLTSVRVPAAPPASARLGADAVHPVRLLDVLTADALAHVNCLDLELPGALPRLGARAPQDPGWRFEGLGDALASRTRPLELRFSDGALDVASLEAVLGVSPAVSMVWLELVRLPVETVGQALPSREGRVPHLRLTETPLDARVAQALASAGALAGLERLEIKDWPVGAPALTAMLKGAPRLKHLAVIRSPLGPELPRLLHESGRLEGLESLDVSGCLLGAAGATKLLELAPHGLARLVVRFNQLTERDVAGFVALSRWPRAEVRFEEVTFGAEAHQALAALAARHHLRLEVAGCVVSLRSSP